jgi:hypothetical protein
VGAAAFQDSVGYHAGVPANAPAVVQEVDHRTAAARAPVGMAR